MQSTRQHLCCMFLTSSFPSPTPTKVALLDYIPFLKLRRLQEINLIYSGFSRDWIPIRRDETTFETNPPPNHYPNNAKFYRLEGSLPIWAPSGTLATPAYFPPGCK